MIRELSTLLAKFRVPVQTTLESRVLPEIRYNGSNRWILEERWTCASLYLAPPETRRAAFPASDQEFQPEWKEQALARDDDSQASPPRSLGVVKRRVTVSSEDLVRFGALPTGDLPLLVQPAVPGVDLIAWAGADRELLEEKLRQHGGILFRGFNLKGPEDLEAFIRTVSGGSLEYRERSSPRTAVQGNIYTSTDYPASQPIFLHNENSYQKEWPLKIFFFCKQPPEQGGETPIADCRKVLARLAPEVRDRFRDRGWMVVRNFGDGLGLSWQTVFQSHDKEQVERHCREKGIEVEWKEGNRLRTRAVRSALVRHPRTGETVWFNHATFFHVSTLERCVRESLLAELVDADLPANTYYGDGTPIEPEVMDHLREAYRSAMVSFPWQKGDLLMLDNMLVAHGRAPFSGPREILVGMAEPITQEQVQL